MKKNKEILNQDVYKIPPRGISSSNKYNNMVDTVFDTIYQIRDEINTSESVYHKSNVIHDLETIQYRSVINSLYNSLDNLKNYIYNVDSGGYYYSFINIGSSDYSYGPIGSTIDPIDISKRCFIDRLSNQLLPLSSKDISKLSMYDSISGNTVTGNNLATITFSNSDNVAFQSNSSYLYDKISSNKWIAVTKYSTSQNKLSDSIDIHIDVPSELISSYYSNYVYIDIPILEMYDVNLNVNMLDGSINTYSYTKVNKKIEIFFTDSQVISIDVQVTSNTPISSLYNGYDSFAFIINDIDIMYIKNGTSSIYLKHTLPYGTNIMTIADVYTVDTNGQKIYNDDIRFTPYYIGSNGNAVVVNSNSMLPLGIRELYILVEYLSDNMYNFIDNVIVKYRRW